MSSLAEDHIDDHAEDQDATFEVVDDASTFFAPVTSDVLGTLIAEYRNVRDRIERAAAALDMEALSYFLTGNQHRGGRHLFSARELFEVRGAIAALNARYWDKALALTDVYDCMPQARRNEWDKSIREMTTPEFTVEAVLPTIQGLVTSREQFFAERVDGIFRGLSGDHVTNAPQGFGRRMIIAYMTDSYGSISYTRSGFIHDLRCVIAKFMGRDDPKLDGSRVLMESLKPATGQWHCVDGGALRIRLYKKGTAHLEVHPDMAWRLNCVLARLYPAAIPSSFRERPRRREKSIPLMQRPLPFEVLDQLPIRSSYGNTYRLDRSCSTAIYAKVVEVIEAIGGWVDQSGVCTFDYTPDTVLREVIVSGLIPERVSHQFYPTPVSIARVCAELAEIGPDDLVLEPEAGRGDLAAVLPRERTTCVEVASLHCDILRARGFTTIKADFLAWSAETEKTPLRFDRIVMNPPFANGRAMAHLSAATRVLAPNGRIVAVLPASMRGTNPLPGYSHEWSRVFESEFEGTGASVAILTAQRPDDLA